MDDSVVDGALGIGGTEFPKEAKESNSASARGSTAVLEDNKHLRYLLFLQHGGAGHMIYGDDGERQCNSCLIDFRKDTVAQIERKTFEYNVKQYEQQWPKKDKQ